LTLAILRQDAFILRETARICQTAQLIIATRQPLMAAFTPLLVSIIISAQKTDADRQEQYLSLSATLLIKIALTITPVQMTYANQLPGSAIMSRNVMILIYALMISVTPQPGLAPTPACFAMTKTPAQLTAVWRANVSIPRLFVMTEFLVLLMHV